MDSFSNFLFSTIVILSSRIKYDYTFIMSVNCKGDITFGGNYAESGGEIDNFWDASDGKF